MITKVATIRKLIPGEIGFNLPDSNQTSTLLTSAEAYFYLGWSVIPLLGDRDPSRPKVPALPWSGFQSYPASLDDHRHWFTEANFAGLGIVTGRVSKLIVLDFDTEEAFQSFSLQYPDLTETRTIRSAGRHLPHLYFRLTDNLYIESAKGQGIDLLSNGRYVVAPPTTINGQPYAITRPGMPKILTERDIRRLQAFLASCKAHSSPVTNTETPSPKSAPQTPVLKPSHHDLENVYRYYCQRGGRNEALFRTSLYARDTGWQELETQHCLVELHSRQPSSASHHPERPEHRRHEARNTIRSAFSRPARPTKARPIFFNNQLSNSLREALMQLGMTYVIRTYEALLQAGVQPGQNFTAKQAIECLKGVVGRDSILNALKSAHKNQRLFASRANDSRDNAVITENPENKQKNAFLLLSKNQEKVLMGRPHHLFRMPSNEALCRLFDVKLTVSDPLQQDDLASAQKTRSAIHRELIKRRPATYTHRWLAQRLGVSRRTIHTYNRLTALNSLSMFTETPINWSTIARLPFDEPLQGAHLESDEGKKYPALRTIAARLLARGQGIHLKQRTGNFYWYGDEQPCIPEQAAIHTHQPQKREAIPSYLAQHSQAGSKLQLVPPIHLQTLPTAQVMPEVNSPIPQREMTQETLAQYLYTTLNQITNSGQKGISQANARRLAEKHPHSKLFSALKLLSETKNLISPIGYFISMLRYDTP